MLRGSTVVDLVNAIVPLYLCVALGYLSSKLRILPHKQAYAGIGAFASKFSVPCLVFRMVATNNPYHMNMKLIEADTLYKVAALFVLSINCFYRPTHQYLAWVSSVFNLATMPNSVLIGTPLLAALYPGTAQDVTTLVFMQCLLWFSVCILILEIHKAVYESSKDFEANELRCLEWETQRRKCVETGKDGDGETTNTETKPDNIVPDQLGIPLRARDLQQVGSQQSAVAADGLVIDISQDAATEREGPQTKYGVVKVKPNKRQAAKKVVQTVLYNFLWAPIVWGSIIGFTYSLLNFKFNHGKALPAILKSLVDLMANCTLGLCMFMLGMNMAVTPKLFACGIPKALLGAGVRFIVAPACMAVVSLAVGLRGNMFRFAVMQAMVPQSLLSFVWAGQYNVYVDIFSTAVWFQTAIFFPFAIALNMLLSVGT